ncbi:IS4 family transposase, partial [Marinomonas sp. CT5]|uniref:transposase domain-containing protein n=1 Tax=Marinomonas sp. CT5 TaxID=2066133 RepID=UPI001BB0A1A1
MSIQQLLLSIDELHSFSNHSTFTQNIPVKWIESALTLSSKATIRRRRLPEDQVLWLVLGMALFRDESIEEVARRLNICSEGLSSEHWANERFAQDDWQGLQVFAMDGVIFRTPDTPDLQAHFGSASNATVKQSAYPLLRCVALMNTHSHVILDAQVGNYQTAETPLAEAMLDKIPDRSTTLLDRNFWSANLMHTLMDEGNERHWLIPKRSNTVYEVVEEYGDGDALWRMTVSPQARKKNPK